MAHSLSNQTILITGSTDGLGHKLALACAQQGSNVIVHGRDAEKTQAIIKELKAINSFAYHSAIVCDLRDTKELTAQLETLTKLDILINNAGVWLEGDSIEATPEKILEVAQVNLTAPLVVTRLLLPTLLQSSFSQVLNISSVAGIEMPAGFYHTYYSAVKYGIQGFSEALAKEFDGKNLRVMGYYPGGMETKLFAKAGVEYEEHEPWMFDPQESVEAIIFMLTRNPKVNVKRMDLINHLQE